jgi:mono/diheme cytochrome c family protein
VSGFRLKISDWCVTLISNRHKSELAGEQRQSEICNLKSAIGAVLLFVCLFSFSGCRRDMQDQPKMKPYRGTSFFGDGLSARPPVEGTIPRGYLRTDTALFTGKKNKALTGATATPAPATAGQNAQAGANAQTGTGAQTGANAYPDDVDTFPFPITEETVRRGQQRYDIFCSVCHGKTGYGDGMIVRRGYRRAASFHDDRLRTAPVGHFFDAITNGWGAMPSYAPQIPVQDRWAIIAYIRALQASQNITTPTPGATLLPSPTPATTGGHK